MAMDISAPFHATLARNASERVPPRDGARHSVLVIEDDEAMLKLVTDILGTAGFATRTGRNRAELTAELNRKPLPDVILLDVNLPDTDGFQVLERIRNHPVLSKVAVILVTGESGVGQVTRGLALGADGYITKPFKLSGMVTAVNTVLGIE
jgi:two-component system OmpR family response regulator